MRRKTPLIDYPRPVLRASRPAEIPRRGRAQRKALLSWLADDVTERPGQLPEAAVVDMLAAWASSSLRGKARDDAWHVYLAAVRLERDLDLGVVPWCEPDPSLKGGGMPPRGVHRVG